MCACVEAPYVFVCVWGGGVVWDRGYMSVFFDCSYKWAPACGCF